MKKSYNPSSGKRDNALREVGLKVTSPRIKIWSVLEKAGRTRHLSAEMIYQLLKDSGEEVNLATVYRVLAQFVEAGLVNRHYFEGGHSVYELDDGDHHDHLVCVHCGRVEEFVDPIIEQHQNAIAKKAGFTITDHCLTIYGLCEACRNSSLC